VSHSLYQYLIISASGFSTLLYDTGYYELYFDVILMKIKKLNFVLKFSLSVHDNIGDHDLCCTEFLGLALFAQEHKE
jgi:hypothetical protein